MAERRSEDFLSRWSRRKRRPESEPEPSVSNEAEARQVGEPVPGDALQRHAEAADRVGGDAESIDESTLPDPDTLGKHDDWGVFLQRGVPRMLRQRALRRLWRLDPVFANLDGLNDYDEDFNDPALLAKPVKTLFKVGRGMVAPEAEAGAEGVAKPAAQAPAEPAGAAAQGSEDGEATASMAAASTEVGAGEEPEPEPEDRGGANDAPVDEGGEPLTMRPEFRGSAGPERPARKRSAIRRRWG